jgi:hypothetical protein
MMTDQTPEKSMVRNSIFHSDGGFALVTVLLIVSLLAVIGITLNRTGGMQTTISYNLNHGEEAYYIANAGLQHAFFALNNDPSLTGNIFSDLPFSNGSYTVTISSVSTPMGNVLVSSTGSTGTAVRTIEKTGFPSFVAYPVLIQDTTMDANLKFMNFGVSPYIKAGIMMQNKEKRGIFAFDLSSLPPGVVIKSAVFELYMYNRERSAIATNSIDVEVHRIDRLWIEGIQDGQNCTVGATQQKADCINNWMNPDFNSVAETKSIVYYNDINTWHKWSITGLVQYWYDNPSSNYGMRLKDDTEQVVSDPFVAYFASGEYSDVNLRPKLTVYYRMP